MYDQKPPDLPNTDEPEEEHLSPGEKIMALEKDVEETQRAFNDACAELEAERRVVTMLKERLVLSETKRIALQVVHGDLAPDQYESRRRAAAQVADQLVLVTRQSASAG